MELFFIAAWERWHSASRDASIHGSMCLSFSSCVNSDFSCAAMRQWSLQIRTECALFVSNDGKKKCFCEVPNTESVVAACKLQCVAAWCMRVKRGELPGGINGLCH